MIERDDLRAAVASGLVNERQAAGLIALADSRRGARENLSEGDEPFELFKGFNEIFIVTGLVILSIGYWIVATVGIGDTVVNLPRRAMIGGGIGAGLVWLLSEYFVRRRRMVAPAITLSILFLVTVAVTLVGLLGQPFMLAQGKLTSLPLPLGLTVLGLLIYWLRFRVPFALALIALGAFAVSIVFTASRAGTMQSPMDLFLLSGDGPFAWVTLGLGLVVFGCAMAFDMSDPHRVTRRSVNGFWLHVVAAPMLVNTIALTLLGSDSPGSAWVLAAILGLFAVIAVVIDRRSFLITAIGYVVTLAGALFGDGGWGLAVLILGFVLLFLGAFWERLRALLLRLLSGVLPVHRLPPAHGG